MTGEEAFETQPYTGQASDPEAHAVVTGLLDEADGAEHYFYDGRELTKFESGQELMRKGAEWNQRGVVALVQQGVHWQSELGRFAEARPDVSEINIRNVGPGASITRKVLAVRESLVALARRRIPLTDVGLEALIAAGAYAMYFHWRCVLPSTMVKFALMVAKDRPLTGAAQKALSEVRVRLDQDHRARDGKLQKQIDGLVAEMDEGANEVAVGPPIELRLPASVGNDGVLVALKGFLGIPTDRDGDADGERVGPDQFLLQNDSPFEAEHKLISEFFTSLIGSHHYGQANLDSSESGLEMLRRSSADRGRLLLAACERCVATVLDRGRVAADQAEHVLWQSHYAARSLPERLAETGPTLDRDGWFDCLLFLTAFGGGTPQVLERIEEVVPDRDYTLGELHVLHRFRCARIDQPPLGVCPPLAKQLCDHLGEPDEYWLVPGEHWADLIHRDLAAMPPQDRSLWQEVLVHAATASSSKPSARWKKSACAIVEKFGVSSYREGVEPWFAAVARGRSIKLLDGFMGDTSGAGDTLNEGNADILRGLLWMYAFHAEASSTRVSADLLITSLKKVPGVGPRAVKVANACVWALGEMASSVDEAIRDASLGELARLKGRVTFKTTLKAIAKALGKAADAAGMSLDDLEELGVPAFGFEGGTLSRTLAARGGSHSGRNGPSWPTSSLLIPQRITDSPPPFSLEEKGRLDLDHDGLVSNRKHFHHGPLGGAEVSMRVEGNRVLTQWTNDKGKEVKSPPASVKRDHKEELKELKQVAKDAEGILSMGRDRLDSSYLSGKSWAYEDWRERYLEHGLLGTLVRRLIWSVEDRAVWLGDDKPVDVGGHAVEIAGDATICLWHPVERSVEEVLAWRSFIEERVIRQPFKQAHREVYRLTDAERRTGVYSNRFAAHVLKQHQFNALCGARRWDHRLRLMVDDEYPATSRQLEPFGLRAEYWVEGAGDEFGRDTTDAGTYLYIVTDQVRFFRAGAALNWQHASGGAYRSEADGPGDDAAHAPLSLDEVPPLVLSEVLRDVDLFVGVSSVGNDPNWSDGGPEGRYREYWHSYSFGELTATAESRKQALERLIPRLNIADRCAIEGRFLIVRGSRRTYKIHLGSGNILMEPNDEYLCIVPKQSAVTMASDKVYLPFEGDGVLAIVLSKALMLADDEKIKDPTIVSQIGG